MKNKKIILFFISFSLFFFQTALAQGPCEIVQNQGIVPCTLTGPNACTLCDLFVMLDRIINYILFCLIPPVAIFMLVIGGLLYVGAVFEFLPGGMETVSRAKRLFTSVIIGILIAYTAWMIINLFLFAIGYRHRENWWQIRCGIGPGGGTIAGPPPLPPTAGNVAALSNPFENNVLVSTPLNVTVSSDDTLFAWQTEPIFSLSISGSITLKNQTSFARVILEDIQGKEYLVLEAIGPFDSGTLNFENACKETCVLNGIIPKRLRSELQDAQIRITQKSELTAKNKDQSQVFLKIQTLGIENYQNQLLKESERLMISKINNYNKQKGLRWTAGETGVSGYTYEQKKVLVSAKDKLPNLMGFEYYKEGIYETTRPQSATQPKTQTTSNLPSSFDWRRRHGQNWITSSVKRQGNCGSCWAFAKAGVLEGVANLYFNQQLNLDLSEQELVSCAHPYQRGCEGITPQQKLIINDYLYSKGIVPEDCFPYYAANVPCTRKCTNPKYVLKIKGQVGLITESDFDEERIKRALIEKGPLYASTVIPGHAIVMVGYEDDPALVDEWDIRFDRFVGMFKNSWGTNWGEAGYARINISKGILIIPTFSYVDGPIEIDTHPKITINCVDEDKDGYCNWGISEQKPTTCPLSCRAEKDCDDSNPGFGPFDANYNCIQTSPVSVDNEPPVLGEPFIDPPQEKYYRFRPYNLKIKVEDNKGVSGCDIFSKTNDHLKDRMHLDFSYCKSCYARGLVFLSHLGRNSYYVKCWDEARNVVTSKEIVIDALPLPPDKSPPTVGKIKPASVAVNASTTFYVDVSDETGVESCSFYVNDDYIEEMTLSEPVCLSCTASITHTFTSAGNYSAYAKCRDVLDKEAKGETIIIRASTADGSLSVSQIQPTTAEINKKQTFYVEVSDDQQVVGCVFKVNGSPVSYMALMKSPCKSCEAWVDYTFTRTGNYMALARCVDNQGNAVEGRPVKIAVSRPEAQCPSTLSYPNSRWERIWYNQNGAKACLGEGHFEWNIKFDNNWGNGKIAYDKSDNIYLTSSRTINFPTAGNYTFTVGSDDGVRVWINDVLYLDKWQNRAYTIDTFNVNLTAGNHKVRIDYYERTGAARLSFSYDEPREVPSCNCTSWSAWQNVGCGQCYCSQAQMCQKRTRTCNPSNCDIVEQTQCVSHPTCQTSTTYNLTTNKNPAAGGTITGPGINCGTDCTENYNSGTQITLQAIPNSGYRFSSWSGACSGTTPTCTLTMNSNKTVIANFELSLTCAWTPCDPSSGWQCGESSGGNPPFCPGSPISWGSGDDGLIYCPEGQIVQTGRCEKKNDDYVKESKEIINVLPHPMVISSSPTIFKPRSAWYCKFGCRGLFCGPDGCAWACCKPGQIQIQRIELKVFDSIGRTVFQKTVDNQNEISWDGKNNEGKYLANGLYLFQAKIYLKDGRSFTNQDKVFIQR